jgi:hypothetical protein
VAGMYTLPVPGRGRHAKLRIRKHKAFFSLAGQQSQFRLNQYDAKRLTEGRWCEKSERQHRYLKPETVYIWNTEEELKAW